MRVPWTARKSDQSILKEINVEEEIKQNERKEGAYKYGKIESENEPCSFVLEMEVSVKI